MRIALDVDGVLADFVGHSLHWVRSQKGVNVWPDRIVTWDVHHYIPEAHHQDLFALWDSRYFCAMLPVISGTRRAVQALRKDHVVKCVTAPMKTNPFWKDERVAWLKHFFGFETQDVIFSHSKHEHAADFDILLDDKGANVTDWTAATGKPAILIAQPWNRGIRVPNVAGDLANAYNKITRGEIR